MCECAAVVFVGNRLYSTAVDILKYQIYKIEACSIIYFQTVKGKD